MKKILWTALLFSGFAMAQQADLQEMPASAEEMLAACAQQAETIPAEARDMFNNTCGCIAETVDFEKVAEFQKNNDQEAMVAHVQEATMSCAPEMPTQ